MEIELPGWRSSRDRYFLIDADGKSQMQGYQQRPTALRRAEQGGFGLYDAREKRLVVPIDYEKRAAWHKDNVARLLDEYQSAQERFTAIRKAQLDAQEAKA